MTPEQKLLKLLDEYGRGAKAKLSKYLDVPPVYVTRWANEEYNDYSIPKEHIVAIENFFQKPAGYILSEDNFKPVSKIPVIGTASCGGPEINFSQEEGAFCYYNGEFFSPELYCVIANGDSMAPDIEDGDEIICDPNVEAEHGDMVHYQLHNESAIKVLVKNEEAGIISLKPYNGSDEFKTRVIRIDDDEMNYLKMNKVVAVNKLKFNNRAARLRLVGE